MLRSTIRCLVYFALTSVSALSAGLAVAAESAPSTEDVTYERDVRPILKAHCFGCHGEAGKREGALDLRLRRLILAGGDSGPAVVPGDVQQSVLHERIAAGEMPPNENGEGTLPAEELEVIAQWIKAGARTARPEPDDLDPSDYITEEERSFWSFQPIRRPSVPPVSDVSQLRTPIDAFVLSQLEANDLSFSPAADRRTLIRRVYFDLWGLPPSPDDVDRFLADRSPVAFERLIDRLLDSPHYGERWGRHWLDVAGYADSEGYTTEDTVREWAFRYRDYVISSYNADKPLDRFIVEQLAGDELAPRPIDVTNPEQVELLAATGFLRMAPDGTGNKGVDQNLARNQVIADTIQIVTSSLLGLSVACAQCHDHRYDPIPQTDYYRMRAVFEPAYDWKNWRVPRNRNLSLYTPADREAVKRIEAEAKLIDAERRKKQQEYIERTFQKELAKLPEDLREPVAAARNTPAKDRTEEQLRLLREYPSVNVTAGSLYLYDRKAADDLKAYTARAAEVRARRPRQEYVRSLTEVPGKIPQTHFFFRGDHNEPRQELEPASLRVLSGDDSRIPSNDESLPTTGRRLAWARQLTDKTTPLTARVLVNRVWAHHFGRGIVASPADFGRLGERPTHPDLLDWLADELLQSGWQLKRLHRLILLSTVYRQSAARSPEYEAVDPDNRRLGRQNTRRLDAEALRDSLLAVSGALNVKMSGIPVPIMENDVGQFVIGIEKKNGENRQTEIISLNGEEHRRSVYVQVRRSRPLGMLDTFDAPRMDPNCEQRASSTVAPQSLMLMNGTFAIEQSHAFAERVLTERPHDIEAQIRLAWNVAYAEVPSDDEVDAARSFLSAQTKHFQKQDKSADNQPKPEDSADAFRQAFSTFCQALLSSNAFLYVE